MPHPDAGTSGSSSIRKTNRIISTAADSWTGPSKIQCCVPECGNNEQGQPGKVYYAFPKETLWRSKWLHLINRPDMQPTADDRVCSDHFSPNQYTVKRALRGDALPTIDKQPTATPLLKRKPEDKNIQTNSKQPRLDTQPNKETEAIILIKIEPEEQTTDLIIKEEPVIEEPLNIEIQCRDNDPLAIPNAEPKKENLINVKEEPMIDTTTETTIHIKIEPDEPTTLNVDPKEDLIGKEKPLHIETQCRDKDPLAIKPETVRTTATQTFSRKKMYLSVACITSAEQINLAQGINEQKATKPAQTQTTTPLLAHFTDPIKKKMKAEIREANRKTKMLSNASMDKSRFMQCCDNYLNEKIAHIVKTHSHIQEKFKGNRYGSDFKVFALNLCLSNPESYRFVEKIFNLPSKTTLQRLQMPARTGTNPNLIEYLKVKVSKMSEKEKLCALCFDVMRVSKNLWYEVNNDFLCGMQEIDQVLGPEPAEYAAMLMIRGLYTKWTQPVSFSFMTEKRRYPELKEWLHRIIGIMSDIGLNVKVIVADLENDFMDISLPNGEHYFEMDERIIYQFYDVRYLFKSARDALMKNNFHIESKVAQWSHILKVYDKDSDHDLSLMPKITDAHVRPSGDALNDVNLAIQIFSNSVAAAMNFHVISNMANQKIKDTVEFIAKMSSILDELAPKSLDNAYKGTDHQNKILSDVLQYLEELKVKDKRGNEIETQFVTGLKVNIKTAVSLLEELKKENLQYLHTKVLSKDCVEVYFDECRRLGGNCCEKPTPIMFARSFRRLFLVNLVHKDIDGDSEDLKSTLYKISEYMITDTEKKDELEVDRLKRILGAGVSDIKIQWPTTEYIAGYLIWKCLEKHPCEKFIEKLSTHYDIPVEENMATLLQNFRQYNAENVNSVYLLKPPGYLVDFVDLMDQKYCEYFTKQDKDPMYFAWNTYKFMEEDTFELPCECFPLKFMKILFIRLKIEHSVREHNKYSKNPRKPRHLQRKQISKKSK
ncbi:uncharacterized protein LOC133531512 isoform X1 [Cydia pomonella]|uniref:uncharacterized protein LOC133531512 isoform X1 n=1 Tax=Cydia pomonella TaxID=82600 RepID=UPI002ADE2411|nr:uncharacterized protein LOC133531512 isoform X1 [Cydia pomonella]